MNAAENSTRDNLIKMVSAVGKTLMENPEKIVGDTDYLSDFTIWIRFPGMCIKQLPEIEIQKEIISKDTIEVLMSE